MSLILELELSHVISGDYDRYVVLGALQLSLHEKGEDNLRVSLKIY